MIMSNSSVGKSNRWHDLVVLECIEGGMLWGSDMTNPSLVVCGFC